MNLESVLNQDILFHLGLYLGFEDFYINLRLVNKNIRNNIDSIDYIWKKFQT